MDEVTRYDKVVQVHPGEYDDVQAILDALSAGGGGTLLFRPGVYTFGVPVQVPPGVSLAGDPDNPPLLYLTEQAGFAVVGPPSADAQPAFAYGQVSFAHLVFSTMSESGARAPVGGALAVPRDPRRAGRVRGVDIHGCTFLNGSHIWVYPAAAAGLHIQDCHFVRSSVLVDLANLPLPQEPMGDLSVTSCVFTDAHVYHAEFFRDSEHAQQQAAWTAGYHGNLFVTTDPGRALPAPMQVRHLRYSQHSKARVDARHNKVIAYGDDATAPLPPLYGSLLAALTFGAWWQRVFYVRLESPSHPGAAVDITDQLGLCAHRSGQGHKCVLSLSPGSFVVSQSVTMNGCVHITGDSAGASWLVLLNGSRLVFVNNALGGLRNLGVASAPASAASMAAPLAANEGIELSPFASRHAINNPLPSLSTWGPWAAAAAAVPGAPASRLVCEVAAFPPCDGGTVAWPALPTPPYRCTLDQSAPPPTAVVRLPGCPEVVLDPLYGASDRPSFFASSYPTTSPEGAAVPPPAPAPPTIDSPGPTSAGVVFHMCRSVRVTGCLFRDAFLSLADGGSGSSTVAASQTLSRIQRCCFHGEEAVVRLRSAPLITDNLFTGYSRNSRIEAADPQTVRCTVVARNVFIHGFQAVNSSPVPTDDCVSVTRAAGGKGGQSPLAPAIDEYVITGNAVVSGAAAATGIASLLSPRNFVLS